MSFFCKFILNQKLLRLKRTKRFLQNFYLEYNNFFSNHMYIGLDFLPCLEWWVIIHYLYFFTLNYESKCLQFSQFRNGTHFLFKISLNDKNLPGIKNELATDLMAHGLGMNALYIILNNRTRDNVHTLHKVHFKNGKQIPATCKWNNQNLK